MTEYQDSHFYEELKESDLYILTEFFKVLGNPNRIRILLLLMEQDLCAGDLAIYNADSTLVLRCVNSSEYAPAVYVICKSNETRCSTTTPSFRGIHI